MDKAEQILKSLEYIGPTIGPVKGKVVEDVIKKYKPKKILEIGTLFGYSAIFMGRLLPKDGKLLTIEISEDNANIVRKNVADAGFSDKVEVIVGDALNIIPKIKEKFDLLLIDATKEEYLKYLKLAEKNLKKDSVVIADNVGIFEQKMLDFLDYVRNSGNYKSNTVKVSYDNFEDAMEISIKL